ncbi:uncharacterized protein RSE6_03177 [Rhynchosporium secalis]|uniref:Uncharacterized protein n=1 Tax=Rhynchosporium secalis TaxID=38038 RepID=A0A1E1M240_RHYSE|nr:uncharacterized protein RSE6_03177 [Rhynchosporium secalis]
MATRYHLCYATNGEPKSLGEYIAGLLMAGSHVHPTVNGLTAREQIVIDPGSQLQYSIATIDARLEDMDRAQWPESHWFPLDFRHDHDRLVSRVDEGAREPYLAGVNANWIDQLGLSNFAPRYGEPAEGLSGNLATIFGMIAMSCSEDRFDSVMGRDPWRGNVWRGHSHRDGRTDDRGVVVRIYFDPDNSLGSTEESLDYLQ